MRLSLEDLSLRKDEKTGHYFFDHIRGYIYHHWNEEEKLGGIGLLTFGPNGTIWSQTSEFTNTLPWWVAFYEGALHILDEARKCKSTWVTIYCDNQDLAEKFHKKRAYQDDAVNNIHLHVVEKSKDFKTFEVVFRDNFPKNVLERIRKDAQSIAQTPLFDTFGRWINSSNVSYYNIGATEEDMKTWAKGWAQMMYDHMQNYLKEYEQDFGLEARNQMVRDFNDGKIKDLPLLKRNLEKEVQKIKLNKPRTTKPILCHNCGEVMQFQSGVHESSKENTFEQYIYKCLKCLSTRILDQRNRTIKYGRHPKPPKA